MKKSCFLMMTIIIGLLVLSSCGDIVEEASSTPENQIKSIMDDKVLRQCPVRYLFDDGVYPSEFLCLRFGPTECDLRDPPSTDCNDEKCDEFEPFCGVAIDAAFDHCDPVGGGNYKIVCSCECDDAKK